MSCNNGQCPIIPTTTLNIETQFPVFSPPMIITTTNNNYNQGSSYVAPIPGARSGDTLESYLDRMERFY